MTCAKRFCIAAVLAFILPACGDTGRYAGGQRTPETYSRETERPDPCTFTLQGFNHGAGMDINGEYEGTTAFVGVYGRLVGTNGAAPTRIHVVCEAYNSKHNIPLRLAITATDTTQSTVQTGFYQYEEVTGTHPVYSSDPSRSSSDQQPNFLSAYWVTDRVVPVYGSFALVYEDGFVSGTYREPPETLAVADPPPHDR